jgi:hypothetical protein
VVREHGGDVAIAAADCGVARHLVDADAKLSLGRRPEMNSMEPVECVADELVGPSDAGLRAPVACRARKL